MFASISHLLYPILNLHLNHHPAYARLYKAFASRLIQFGPYIWLLVRDMNNISFLFETALKSEIIGTS